MILQTDHLNRCILTLESSVAMLRAAKAGSIDSGVAFAEETLLLLPGFIADARALAATLKDKLGHAGT